MQQIFNIDKVKPGETFPVKVQVSLTKGSDETLIYGRDKVLMTLRGRHFPRSVGEELLGKDLKGYFNAHVTEDGKISFDCRIPDQVW